MTAGKVVRAITELASAHSLEVVAEGIEDAQALEQVSALRLQYAQGYHVGRPQTAAAIETLLVRVVPGDRGVAPCAAA